MDRLALDPLFAALPDFLLPDGDDFLEAVDQSVTGLERRFSVGRRYGDEERRLAYFEAAGAVLDGYIFDLFAALHLFGDLPHHFGCHLGVRVVFEVEDLATHVVVADDAVEQGDGTTFVAADVIREPLGVERVSRYFKEHGRLR